jgi:hypothetical protein
MGDEETVRPLRPLGARPATGKAGSIGAGERRRFIPLTRIILPPIFEEVPFVPDVQVVYWVDTGVLPPGDPEPQRPVVVMAAPPTTAGTVRVATRSSTEEWGIPHPRSEALGLSKDGWFSRRANVLCELWTLSNVRSTGTLDDETFAAVCARFL